MKLSQLSLADYNKLDNIPVINQDLSASGFTPVANTYYRHTGATTDTFTQGVIYCYDGTEYKALDGSGGGGISDVQVNGTSVVTDGVANIPEHSGTAMLAPSTWSSGTGGSLTLTESGTYQFYTGTAAKINYTLLYVELGKESIAYAGKNVQLEIDTNNVVHVFDMSQAEPVEKTVTLKYRRIGI